MRQERQVPKEKQLMHSFLSFILHFSFFILSFVRKPSTSSCFTFILHPLAFILFFCPLIFAQDITVSKDSIQVYNSLLSSFADNVTFTSHSSTPIHLDSVFVLITELDTIGYGRKGFEVTWKSDFSSSQTFVWTMDSIAPNSYRLVKNVFSPSTAVPLSFSGNKDSCQMFFLEMGSCFMCALFPKYPRYIKGTMKLYFNNGQVVELRLWSNDLRASVRPKGSKARYSSFSPWSLSKVEVHPSSFPYQYLTNGRKIFAGGKTKVSKNRISCTRLYESK
jgi:hypothetical protein